MARPSELKSPLARGISRFLETRRALGRKYLSEERELRLLDRFLVHAGITSIDDITPAVIEVFLASRPRKRARSFNHLLGNVRRLFEWLAVQGEPRLPPVRVARRRETAQRVPFIFDTAQARRLLDAALALPDRSTAPRRGPTYRALFALLYALGLRVGEACSLVCNDVDLQRRVLVVRGGKFGKSRLVPFGPRVAGVLQSQISRCAGSALGSKSPLFSFDGRRAIHPGTASQTFLRIVRDIGFAAPDGVARPRLHDLRHSFAVGTLLRWYREGINPAARLHQLSTFLGHVDPVSTSVYLTMTDSLLREAGRRFEGFSQAVTMEVGR